MGVVFDNFDLYWSGFLTSVQICFLGLVGSLILGILIAALRVSPVPTMRWVGTAYVNIVRNTPLTVVLFFFAFGLPELGINASYYRFGLAALVIYTSAFVCEAVRSGINSISAGQAEAARSIGLTFGQSLTLIVLPQALRTVVPPLGSVLIAMFKNSAVLGAFGVGGDLWSTGQNLASAQGYASLPVFTGVAIGYLCITIPAGIALQVIERKVAIAR
ncbi:MULTISPECIES: amino acid ABC transporter permease [Antrihabitans]|uniref:Amino acid ABC transporter permease n=2 Tax=Antrihabitans TaxID=2799491 RepID=A0A934U618_9NOCA|nr:amino acid ABC transporter permease [Antrihabitans stalagmiti]MBJ8341463.1 amino acid ABC transporter permease [Antrihabitans stalagmiti]